MSELNEVQRNWRATYDNNQNRRKSGPETKILYFVLLLAITLLVYKCWEYENSKSKNGNTETVDKETTLVIYNSDHKLETIKSNRNGIVMANSVNKILEIINDLPDTSKNNYDYYINEINNMDLSDEYNKFKSAAIDKINYFSDYITYDYNEKAFNKYKNIDIHKVLAECFDDADVDYIIEDSGKKRFWYRQN